MDKILHDIPGNPLPDPHRAGYFESHDGARLRYAVFKGTTYPSKGTVVLVHGRSECIEKYAETIRDLTRKGLWVATYDLRGQGLSDRPLKDPLRGHVRRFTDYERDLESFLEKVALPDARLPLFLMAHSTGGLIALATAPKLGNRIQRMVLSAPFVGLHGEIMAASKIFALARFACLLGVGNMALSKGGKPPAFDNNPLTTDADRFMRNVNIVTGVPALALGPPSARWLHECDKAIRRVNSPDHLTRITIPTLLLAPMQDGVVPFVAQEQLARHFRACQLLPIPGARHEVLQEQDRYREQALAAIHAFIPGSDAAESLGGEEDETEQQAL
ncbi:alpha/beta fold hydrolase [Rhizobium paknamense]|uniref:Lysophospholipase n=1 Tax=Rhizobium paknamense TaxID=1206817 RepID=A0ABU0IIV7_9HYPH|nr:alpha/beta hydrolase [Rhizobium paknamense]MDQ0458192.1 lysophospholipase [Rhizobium paknamense]